ncbi:HD-GYP domain-containing protein [Agaribacter flavus]|uniref:HD-GYP domain-containing protein n=1 Tax=Agaribacter flavus TaxID=1902781 RepID=A0ABV7FMF5_9ALTE
MNQTIPIQSLTTGMYLIRVVEAPVRLQVKRQGIIKSQTTIDNLIGRGVVSVEIDVDKSEADSLNQLDSTSNKSDEKQSHTSTPSPKKITSISFEEQQQQLAAADKLYTQARAIQCKFVKSLRSGQAPDFDALHDLTQDIIDSVFDNPEALSCLVMLKESNDYLVQHSLNCAILLSLFAKHKQLPQNEVEDLTYSGLLMDIGMTLLPPELAENNKKFSEADIVVMRTHVDIGIEILERHGDFPPTFYDVIKHHHERIDGSGYLKGLTGDEISLHAQMAAIVDTYDAMITSRPYRGSASSQATLEEMLEDPGFDQALVEDFIEAIGLYPVGSLVHLESGKLAIVAQANRNNALKPKVMSFYSIRGKHHTEIKIIDLSKSTERIKTAVRPEEFDINLPKFFRTALYPA